MSSLASLIMALTSSVVARALTSLGIGLVVYTGLDTLVSSISDTVVANYGAVSGAPLQFLNLAGVGEFIGIVLGAFTARVSLIALKKYRPI